MSVWNQPISREIEMNGKKNSGGGGGGGGGGGRNRKALEYTFY